MDWPGVAEKPKNPVTHRGGRCRVGRPDLGASGGDWP